MGIKVWKPRFRPLLCLIHGNVESCMGEEGVLYLASEIDAHESSLYPPSLNPVKMGWGHVWQCEVGWVAGDIERISVVTSFPRWGTQHNFRTMKVTTLWSWVVTWRVAQLWFWVMSVCHRDMGILVVLKGTGWRRIHRGFGLSVCCFVGWWWVQYIFLHEEYQQHVLPRIVESKKLAKAGRSKARDADAEYNLAKLVEKQMWYVVRAHSHI